MRHYASLEGLAAVAALSVTPSTRHSRIRRLAAAVEPETTKAVEPPKCPLNAEAQLLAARDAVLQAAADGVTRQQLRTLLRRDGELVPPDETWTGGIMQLYGACRPLARDLLRKVGEARETETPTLREQRLDASGVDGESLLLAEGQAAKNDVSLFLQPSTEVQKTVESVSAAAGPRLVLTLNPQYRDVDDTLDFLAKQTGLFGAVGGFLGGKAALTKSMNTMGFRDTFSLQEFVVKGTLVRIFLAYPFGWRIFALSDRDDEAAISLGSSGDTRPDYNIIAEVLEANAIEPKIFRDVGRGKALVQGSIATVYEDLAAGR